MTSRQGLSLVELAAGLALGGIIATLLLGVLTTQLRLARYAADRVAEGDAMRTASHVLEGESRRMAVQDVRTHAPDSIAVRAFRGAGIPCATTGSQVVVRYAGERMPDPAKDSVVVVSPLAGETVAALAAQRPGAGAPCMPRDREVLLEWQLDPAPPAASLLLVFESGSYYLSAGALRYRLGAEGRQPVTPDLFQAGATRFDGVAGGSLHVTLATPSMTRRRAFRLGAGP